MLPVPCNKMSRRIWIFIYVHSHDPCRGEVFKNCDALKRTYPNGVAKSQAAKDGKEYSNPIVNESVYNANRRLDGNDDGVMCDSK